MGSPKSTQKKAEALILHFANKVPLRLGYTKLAKLMYFVDFTYFELKQQSITGLIYKKYHYGPMPKNFYQILRGMEKRGLVSVKPQEGEYLPASIQPKAKPDYSVFSREELSLIKVVTEKFKNATAKELEQEAKSEPPYKMVEFDKDIPYHLAFYRNSFGEMELENEDSP